MMIRLNKQQREIVKVIEKTDMRCMVFIPRGNGKSEITVFLSEKYSMPIMAPTLMMCRLLVKKGASKDMVVTSDEEQSWRGRKNNFIIDEVTQCKNIPPPDRIGVVFTSDISCMGFKSTLHDVKLIKEDLHKKALNIAYIDGYIVRPFSGDRESYMMNRIQIENLIRKKKREISLINSRGIKFKQIEAGRIHACFDIPNSILIPGHDEINALRNLLKYYDDTVAEIKALEKIINKEVKDDRRSLSKPPILKWGE